MLEVRAVRTVLVASSAAAFGSAAVVVALLLRVHESGRGPWAVSVLLLCSALPVVLSLGLAGAVADRLDRRRVLVVTGLVQVVATAGLALVDGFVATCALMLVLQTGFALGQPSWQAMVPSLVDDGQAGQVIALQHALRGVAAPAGAALGGAVVQWSGTALALLPSVAGFVVVTAAASRLPASGASVSVTATDISDAAACPLPSPAASTEQPEQPDRAETAGRRERLGARGWLGALLPRDGVVTLRADRGLGVLVLVMVPLVVTLESVNVVEVFLLRDVLGASPAQYGVSEAIAGAAAVLGALVAGLLTSRATRTRAVLGGAALIAMGQVGQGVVPTYVGYVVLAAAVGAVLGILNASLFALLVDEVDPARRGSVLALVGGMARAATGLALLLGGTLGTVAGPRAAYLVAGGAGLAVAAAGWFAHRSFATRADTTASSR